MGEDTKVSLEARLKELKEEFDSLDKEREKLTEEGKRINQKLSEIRTRQLQLQGSYSEVSKLVGADESVKEEAEEAEKQ